jgi:hypothetical protein
MSKFSVVHALCASLVFFSAHSGAATKPAAPARVPGLEQVKSLTLANGM